MLLEQERDDVVRTCRELAAAGPRLLPADEIALVAGQLASYGQRVPDGKPGR